MPCELEPESTDNFAGTSLYQKRGRPCINPASVYWPPNHDKKSNLLNVVLWLHGFDVKNERFLLPSDRGRERQQVLNSKKDVVLIAPFLGYEHWKDDTYTETVGTLIMDELGTAKWGERFLTEVLQGIGDFVGLKPAPDIKNLIIACHSGGGEGMRNMVGTLGKFQSKLQECWGFDCLYHANPKNPPDDANFWFDHTLNKDTSCPLVVFFGPSTIRQSVKLRLMGQGKADGKGNENKPPKTALKDLNVTIGLANVDVDKLMNQSPPGAKPPARPAVPKDGDFVAQAAGNLTSQVAFGDDIHYDIARDFFLERLKNVTFR
jgi:hypothetical protein